MKLFYGCAFESSIPPAFPSTGTYAETQSLCGQEYVSPSSTVFVYMRYFKQGSFIFDLFAWVRIVISQVGKVHLLRFRLFYVFNLSSRPCLIGVGIWFFIFGLFWKDQMTVLLSSKYMLSILVFNLA